MRQFELLHINEHLPHGFWAIFESDVDGWFLCNIFAETRNNQRKREREVKKILDIIFKDEFFSDEGVFVVGHTSVEWKHELFDDGHNNGYTHIDLKFNKETMAWFLLTFRGEYQGDL